MTLRIVALLLALAAIAALAVLSMSGSKLGMGAVALFFFAATVAVGLIVGMLSLGLWGAWRDRRAEAG